MFTPKISFFAVLIFFCFASLLAPAAVKVQDLKQADLNTRQKAADDAWAKAVRGNNISAGNGIEDIVATAEMLRDKGDENGAREYFRRATIIAPLRVDLRFAYARLCAKADATEVAKNAYKIVLVQAETDEMLDESAKFLGIGACEKLPALASAPTTETQSASNNARPIRLCLVTVPGAQQWLAHDVGVRLRRLLKIEVFVEECDFVPTQPDRGGLAALASQLRKRLPWHDPKFAALAVRLGINDRDAASDQQIMALARTYTKEFTGDTNAEDFDKATDLVEKRTSQWQAGLLLTRLAISTKTQAGVRTLFVALIPQDIFEGDNNYMLGSTFLGGDQGVVSYCRFAAEFAGETPKRERLVMRTYKQMLSSIGFMLGVPRTTDPMCARAYPASLEEHDAKGDKLCDACRAGFAKALGHELGE